MGWLSNGRICTCALLLASFASLTPLCLYSDPVCFFLNHGEVLKIDIPNRRITPAGSLHRSAPEIDVSPDGLVWGRGSLTSIAALNPSSGERVATIEIPERPYAQIITSTGMMYVAHNTLTQNGFSMSVVDLSAGAVVARIQGIQGLVTGLAQDREYVYVAALGVRRPDFLYLYRIDARTQDLEEIYRVPKTEYRWEISVRENRLYITYVRGEKGDAPPLIEVADLRSTEIEDRWALPGAAEIGRFTQGISFDDGSAFAPVLGVDGHPRIVVLDSRSGTVQRVLSVSHAPGSVIGAHEGVLVRSVDPQATGTNRASLFFHDIRRGTEVCSVIIPNQTLEEAPQ